MPGEERFKELSDSVVDLETDNVKSLTSGLLDDGVDPLKIIDNGLSEGMKIVGKKFDNGELFLPDLIEAADVFGEAMEILKPELKGREEEVEKGTVVIGTVEGDIHSIGKDIVGILLKADGFEVHNLGEDVKSSDFVKKADEVNADVICLSALLTTTMASQGEVIRILEELDKRDKYYVVVGGSPVSQEHADEIGADGYGENARDAVELVQDLLAEKGEG